MVQLVSFVVARDEAGNYSWPEIRVMLTVATGLPGC